MSRKVYKRVQVDGSTPLVFEEKAPAVGDGKRAFKTLTAAVRAAEAARDEVKAELAEARELAAAYRAAAEELVEAAMGRLRMAERGCCERAAMARRWVWVDLVIFGVGSGVLATGCALGWW
ncbi:MAG: hypothetical protein IJA63_05960 [Akkermansia sp.]|nr:hypothetical protein [Akkermansia sp.]